jgi:hypothetical protein
LRTLSLRALSMDTLSLCALRLSALRLSALSLSALRLSALRLRALSPLCLRAAREERPAQLPHRILEMLRVVVGEIDQVEDIALRPLCL